MLSGMLDPCVQLPRHQSSGIPVLLVNSTVIALFVFLLEIRAYLSVD